MTSKGNKTEVLRVLIPDFGSNLMVYHTRTLMSKLPGEGKFNINLLTIVPLLSLNNVVQKNTVFLDLLLYKVLCWCFLLFLQIVIS